MNPPAEIVAEEVVAAEITAAEVVADEALPDDASQEQQQHSSGSSSTVVIKTVPWLRQLNTILWYKNLPLLQRRPILLLIMVFSSVGSVLLAWPAGKDYKDDVVWPPLNECGTIDPSYFDELDFEEREKVPLSLNDSWREGLPVAVMSLGPMVTAICVFLVVHSELELQMLGVLRGGLGLLDSVYWVGWYAPFAIIAFVNSLLGAFTAKMLPVHVFQSTYFGGIFGSLLFLQLSLVGSSLFLAAVLGKRRRGSVWLILVMICALWVPFLVIFFTSPSFYLNAEYFSTVTNIETPVGLFWVNQQTSTSSYTYDDDLSFNGTLGECELPILSEKEGTFLKTTEERVAVGPDSFFLGCYAAAGWGASQWSRAGKAKIGLAAMWFFPYFHFTTIWGNFAGFTAYPETKFNANHAALTAGELARNALPVPSESKSVGTTLFPQGTMLQLSSTSQQECEIGDEYFCEKYKSNCPAEDLQGFNFCSLSQCLFSPDPSPAEGKSVYQVFGMLLALSLIYLLMAIYWGIVFVGGAGTHPFYFLFQKSYWFGAPKDSNTHISIPGDTETGAVEAEAAVRVNGLCKLYGSMEAVSNVSLPLVKGEVTAILGHVCSAGIVFELFSSSS